MAAAFDLATRKIVGWAEPAKVPPTQPVESRQGMRGDMRTELPLGSLVMAVQRQRPRARLICHSDRGSQYAAEIYQQQLGLIKATDSMGRKGCCYGNVPMESIFHPPKVEPVHQQQ